MPDARNSWQPVDLLALEERPLPRPGVGGVIYPGARHQFVGESEALKTLYAFILGLETIRAGEPVLHIDFEMYADRTRERLREMGATDDELRSWIHVEPDAAPRDGDLEALIARTPGLAIIDAAAGAYDMLGLDDNKRADVERYTRAIVAPLHRAGIATVTIDHVTKSRDGRGKDAIGSERKRGGSDVTLTFEPVKAFHRGGTGLVKIGVAKDRFGHLPRPLIGELHLASDPDTHAITWTLQDATPDASPNASDWKPTQIMENVSRHLEKQTEPLSRAEIVQTIGGQRKYVLQAIDLLIAGGFAVNTDGPRGAKLTSTLHPFRVPDPFSPVPENPERVPVLPFPPPTGGNGSENGSTDHGDDAEVERLVAKYGEKA